MKYVPRMYRMRIYKNPGTMLKAPRPRRPWSRPTTAASVCSDIRMTPLHLNVPEWGRTLPRHRVTGKSTHGVCGERGYDDLPSGCERKPNAQLRATRLARLRLSMRG